MSQDSDQHSDQGNDGRDHYDELAEQFSQQQQKEREEIVKANEHGNGFADGMSTKTPNTQDGTYNPQKLNARHREIIRLTSLGYKGTMIAKMIGCTPQTVYNIVNSPLGESLLGEIEQARTGSVKEVQDRLQEASPLAAEIVIDIMNDGKKETNKLKSALKVLEMTGHKPGEKHQHVHTHLSKNDIDEIKQDVQEQESYERNTSFNESNKPEKIQDAEVIEEDE